MLIFTAWEKVPEFSASILTLESTSELCSSAVGDVLPVVQQVICLSSESRISPFNGLKPEKVKEIPFCWAI